MTAQLTLRVDRNQIDVELESLPEDIKNWGEALSEAIADADRADQEMKLCYAKTNLDIRANPTKYGNFKITEDVVTQLTLIQPEYQEKVTAHNEARQRVSGTKAILEALDAKRASCKQLTELILVGYVAMRGPKSTKVPAGIRQASNMELAS